MRYFFIVRHVDSWIIKSKTQHNNFLCNSFVIKIAIFFDATCRSSDFAPFSMIQCGDYDCKLKDTKKKTIIYTLQIKLNTKCVYRQLDNDFWEFLQLHPVKYVTKCSFKDNKKIRNRIEI